MFVYLMNIFVTIALFYAFMGQKNWGRNVSVRDKDKYFLGNKNKKYFCICCSFLWIILSGFRHLSVGTDTIAYEVMYNQVKSTSWETLISNIVVKLTSIETMLEGDAFNKDPGFMLLMKVEQLISPSYRIFLILVAIFFMFYLGRFLYKYSRNPLLGFIVFDCLFYSFYAITGIRQTIATALIVFIGYDYIKERKLVHFLIISFISFLIHKSSICFIPFYFIYDLKINKITLSAALVFIASSFVFKDPLMGLLSEGVGYEQYNVQYDYNGPIFFTLLVIALLIGTVLFRRRMYYFDHHIDGEVWAIIATLFFIPLAYIDPSAMRVAYYYALFIMLLLPKIIDVTGKYRQVFSLILIILMILMLIKNNPYYMFMEI